MAKLWLLEDAGRTLFLEDNSVTLLCLSVRKQQREPNADFHCNLSHPSVSAGSGAEHVGEKAAGGPGAPGGRRRVRGVSG